MQTEIQINNIYIYIYMYIYYRWKKERDRKRQRYIEIASERKKDIVTHIE